eukprot:TCALIF_09862-PA protein Name:"Protein of unknown function" AED:0.00 eAED:0.00 QI:265/1/1/1/1/1/2/211/31
MGTGVSQRMLSQCWMGLLLQWTRVRCRRERV